MANPRAAFDLLFDLLHQASDDEIESALEIVRRYSAEVSLPRDSRNTVDVQLLIAYAVASFLLSAVERLVSCLQHLLGRALFMVACSHTNAYG